jgi:starch synthase
VAFDTLDALGLEPHALDAYELGASGNLLKGAILNADVVTTTSASYASALTDPTHFGQLATELRDAKVDIYGVLGGIDYSVWNPATDTALTTRFDAESSELKGVCKTALLRELGIEIEIERPLLGVVLDDATGAELVADSLSALLKEDLTLIVASAVKDFTKVLSAKSKRARNYRLMEEVSPGDLRRALAGADLALFPRRGSSSGHDSRVAHRYGALPIAFAAPGNLDSIVDCDPELTSGTGFLFAEASSVAMRGAVSRALVATRQPGFGALRRRVMRQDLGWERAARRYAQLYRLAAQG